MHDPLQPATLSLNLCAVRVLSNLKPELVEASCGVRRFTLDLIFTLTGMFTGRRILGRINITLPYVCGSASSASVALAIAMSFGLGGSGTVARCDKI